MVSDHAQVCVACVVRCVRAVDVLDVINDVLMIQGYGSGL